MKSPRDTTEIIVNGKVVQRTELIQDYPDVKPKKQTSPRKLIFSSPKPAMSDKTEFMSFLLNKPPSQSSTKSSRDDIIAHTPKRRTAGLDSTSSSISSKSGKSLPPEAVSIIQRDRELSQVSYQEDKLTTQFVPDVTDYYESGSSTSSRKSRKSRKSTRVIESDSDTKPSRFSMKALEPISSTRTKDKIVLPKLDLNVDTLVAKSERTPTPNFESATVSLEYTSSTQNPKFASATASSEYTSTTPVPKFEPATATSFTSAMPKFGSISSNGLTSASSDHTSTPKFEPATPDNTSTTQKFGPVPSKEFASVSSEYTSTTPKFEPATQVFNLTGNESASSMSGHVAYSDTHVQQTGYFPPSNTSYLQHFQSSNITYPHVPNSEYFQSNTVYPPVPHFQSSNTIYPPAPNSGYFSSSNSGYPPVANYPPIPVTNYNMPNAYMYPPPPTYYTPQRYEENPLNAVKSKISSEEEAALAEATAAIQRLNKVRKASVRGKKIDVEFDQDEIEEVIGDSQADEITLSSYEENAAKLEKKKKELYYFEDAIDPETGLLKKVFKRHSPKTKASKLFIPMQDYPLMDSATQSTYRFRLRNALESLKKDYPHWKIPNIPPKISLTTLHVIYSFYAEHEERIAAIGRIKMIMMAGWIATEMILRYFTPFDIQGYSATQMKLINSYSRMLYRNVKIPQLSEDEDVSVNYWKILQLSAINLGIILAINKIPLFGGSETLRNVAVTHVQNFLMGEPQRRDDINGIINNDIQPPPENPSVAVPVEGTALGEIGNLLTGNGGENTLQNLGSHVSNLLATNNVGSAIGNLMSTLGGGAAATPAQPTPAQPAAPKRKKRIQLDE